MYDPYANFQKHIFKNGLKVFHLKINRPFLKVGFTIHSGANADPVNMPGLAHFTEHLVSESKKGHSMESITDLINVNGGKVMLGSTSWDNTMYGFEIPSQPKIINTSFQIFSGILGGGEIIQNIERERSAIISEYMQKFSTEDDNSDILNVRKHIFHGHPAEIFVRPLGSLESVKNITQKDLQKFYREHYVAENMSIVSCGDMEINEIIEYLEKNGFTNKASGSLFKNTQLIVNSDSTHHIYTELEPKVKKRLEQFRYVRVNALSHNLCNQKLRIFTNILNEILFKTIRHKANLAYSFNAGYVQTADFYEFNISGTIKDSGKNQIMNLVEKSLNKVIANKKLFEKHKKICLLAMQLIDPSYTDIIMSNTEDISHYGYIESLQNTIQRIQNVSFNDINDIYKMITAGNIYTLIQN